MVIQAPTLLTESLRGAQCQLRAMTTASSQQRSLGSGSRMGNSPSPYELGLLQRQLCFRGVVQKALLPRGCRGRGDSSRLCAQGPVADVSRGFGAAFLPPWAARLVLPLHRARFETEGRCLESSTRAGRTRTKPRALRGGAVVLPCDFRSPAPIREPPAAVWFLRAAFTS